MSEMVLGGGAGGTGGGGGDYDNEEIQRDCAKIIKDTECSLDEMVFPTG